MIEILFQNPHVFYGQDLFVDIFSALVVLAISFFSFKNYKLSSNKKHLWIASTFLAIGIAFIFEILTNFNLYRQVLLTKQVGLITLTYEGLIPLGNLFFIGILGYQIFMLFGLYFLFMLYQNKRSVTNFIITTYLLLISLYFIQKEVIFHITAALLLILITSEYYVMYKKNKMKTTRLLMCSFGVIAFSHLMAIFLPFNPLTHFISGIVQLVGYVVLLLTFISVLKNAKKAR